MSARRQAAFPVVEITQDLAHTYIPMQPEPDDLAAIDVHIKRADGSDLGSINSACCTPWLLRYPAHDYDAGHIGFRWDAEIHALPPGRYIAEIQVDCEPCHRFTLVARKARFAGTGKGLTVSEVT